MNMKNGTIMSFMNQTPMLKTFENTHAFNVFHLETREVLHFHRVNENEWKEVRKGETKTIPDAQALQAYNYFTSQWMDFDVE